MRVAVIGGTGLVGRHTTTALRHAGHDAVVVARSTGIDVTTGAGLDAALAGVQAVVDVTSTLDQDAAAAQEFFGTATGHILAAEQRAGVEHHVVLSIVGVDRVEGTAHYAGKRRQEALVQAGSIPATIVRATQFHEFAELASLRRRDGR
ncbi:MAG: SDR family oxidoreductase [Pseudonocardiaceae bacterium]